jgi:DNA polymerase-3 subunit epsilon
VTALLDAPLAFVDVETTGGHPLHHRIIEIGVVLAHGEAIEESWTTLVDPGTWLPPTIQRLTGIDPDALRGAPPFRAIADELAARLEGRLFIAHNARFDYGFVRNELKRAGHAFDARLACTVKLSRRFYPGMPRHNLDALIARHALPCAARHRALPDAMALWQFWRVLRANWPPAQLEAALNDITRRTALPPQLAPELADELPQSAGVYRFYGEGDALLYVGKARNLRERVLAHWAAAPRSLKARRLSTQTTRVEWTETAGELGALLLEARCVRESQPLYNRRLRGGGEALSWQFDDVAATPRLVSLDEGWPAGDCFGLYRSEREAIRALEQLARQHALCMRVLGLESGAGSCFAYQLQRCRGACVGAESPQRHLARSKLAFAAQRLKPWPYDGAVAIHERVFGGLEQWHVIDGWRFLGTVTRHEGSDDSASGPELLPGGVPGSFDVDAYRTLARFLAAQPRGIVAWPPRA